MNIFRTITVESFLINITSSLIFTSLNKYFWVKSKFVESTSTVTMIRIMTTKG